MTIHQNVSRSPAKPLSALLAGLVLSAGLAPCLAQAVDFPITGTITVNGNSGALPPGGKFANSDYNPTTGAIAEGAFSFPVGTTSFPVSGVGTVTVTYQLSQLDTSTGQVATDGTAALTTATMKLEILTASVGVIPIGVGTCIFQPINFDLSGMGSASGLDLSDAAFTIPPVGPTDCGTFGSQINANIAGSNNSAQMHMAGDFTPPPADDTIFANGFESPNRFE